MSKAREYLADKDGYVVLSGGSGEIHVPIAEAEKLSKWLHDLLKEPERRDGIS